MLLIILIFTIIFIVLFFIKSNQEHFNNIKLGLHSVYDSRGIGLYTDITPPCKRGDQSCYIFKCPAFNTPHTTCWKCEDIIIEPQNS